MDKIVKSPAVRYRQLADRTEGESSVAIAERVQVARQIQLERFKGTKVHCNAQMSSRHIRKHCEPDAAGHRLLEPVTDRLGLSARAYMRLLKVAWTTADLGASEHVGEQHLAGSDPVPEPGQEGALIYRQPRIKALPIELPRL